MESSRILLVEDERITAEDIRRMLASRGHEVVGIASTGEESIEMAKAQRPDLVLMDIMLQGGMDGIEAAERITSACDIPVIYLTAFADESTINRARLTAPYGYIIKPVESRELHSNIAIAIEKHRMERRLRESERRYRTLIDNAASAIILINNETVTFANAAAAELLGRPADELVGANMLGLVHDDFREAVRSRFQAIMRGERVDSRCGFKVTGAAAGDLWIECNSIPVEFDGRPIILLEAIDITAKKRAESIERQAYDKLQKTLNGFIQTIALMLEIRDPYTAGHQRRVARLAAAIAGLRGFPPEMIESIQMAGFVHDIGKISVPAEILSKPGRLTQTEYQLIQIHSQIGFDILKNIDFPWPIARIVLEHHERLDGTGYPRGIAKDDLLTESSVIIVSDVVEAMASHRPYRAALGVERAMEEITSKRGVSYDPETVDACVELFRAGFSFED